MNNGQTPGGNTTTAGAVEMARRIAASAVGATLTVENYLSGRMDDTDAVRAALAAIIETQERDARIAEQHVGQSSIMSLEYDEACRDIASAIRSDDHLKGPQP